MQEEEGTSSGAFIVIAAVVLFGMIAAFVFMRYMLNQSKVKMIEQANMRHKKISDLHNEVRENELMHAKFKKGQDNLHGDSDGAKVMNL